MTEFLDCVRSRRRPRLTIEDAYRSTATVQLGMIAYETGLPVEWDEAAEEIRNNPAGAKLLRANTAHRGNIRLRDELIRVSGRK